MPNTKQTHPRAITIVIGVIILSAAIALAAANQASVAHAAGGDSAMITSGYTIGDPTYNLNTTDPTQIDQVRFTVSGTPNAAYVRARFDADGAWYNCILTDNTSYVTARCDTTVPQLTVRDADQFQVVASREAK